MKMESLMFRNDFFDDLFRESWFSNDLLTFKEIDNQAPGYRYVDKEKNEDVVVIQVPGFSKDDIEINVEENGLKISGELKDEKLKEKIGENKFSYFVRLKNLNPKNVEASLENGILEIRCKRKEKKSTKVTIK